MRVWGMAGSLCSYYGNPEAQDFLNAGMGVVEDSIFTLKSS